jgi:hypothetical protein
MAMNLIGVPINPVMAEQPVLTDSNDRVAHHAKGRSIRLGRKKSIVSTSELPAGGNPRSVLALEDIENFEFEVPDLRLETYNPLFERIT